MSLEIWLSPAISVAFLMIIGRRFLKSYISTKAENLATKEDIRDITQKVEEVRHDYARSLEVVKASLHSQLQISQIRYTKEVEILSELTEKVVELRDAALTLRPAFDSIIPDETEEDRKQKRLSRYSDAMRALYLISENRRPLYPDKVYNLVSELSKASWSEATAFRFKKIGVNSAYWDEAQRNAAQISTLAEKVMAAIRDRIKYWERLDSGS